MYYSFQCREINDTNYRMLWLFDTQFGSVSKSHGGRGKGADPTLTPTWKLLIKS